MSSTAQAGAPGAAGSWARLGEAAAATCQRVWLAVAVAAGLANTSSPADLPAWAASSRRRVMESPAASAPASPITRARAPDFSASSMVHSNAAGFFRVTVMKRRRASPSPSSPWP